MRKGVLRRSTHTHTFVRKIDTSAQYEGPLATVSLHTTRQQQQQKIPRMIRFVFGSEPGEVLHPSAYMCVEVMKNKKPTHERNFILSSSFSISLHLMCGDYTYFFCLFYAVRCTYMCRAMPGSGFSICIQPKLIDGEGVERHRLRPPPYQSYGFRILTHSLTHWLHCVRRLATARVFPNTQGQIECNINEKWKRDEIEIRSIFISSYGLFHSHHTHVDVPTPPLCRWRCCEARIAWQKKKNVPICARRWQSFWI